MDTTELKRIQALLAFRLREEFGEDFEAEAERTVTQIELSMQTRLNQN